MIDELLGNPGMGLIAAVRPTQLDMAHSIERAMEEGVLCLAEAGTGTGKSYAYLVPGIQSIRARPSARIIISTGKKTLQGQLVDKDLPKIKRIVNGFTYDDLKGKSNYYCESRYQDFNDSGLREQFGDTDFDQLETSVNEGNCDLTKFPGSLRCQHLINITHCVGRHCSFREICPYLQHRVQALKAKILVTNHALLSFDFMLGRGTLLGEYDTLVVDEAHQFPKFIREAWTCKLERRAAKKIERTINGAKATKKGGAPLRCGPHFLSLVDDVLNELNNQRPGLIAVTSELKDNLENLRDVVSSVLGDVHVFLERVTPKIGQPAIKPTDDELRSAIRLGPVVKSLGEIQGLVNAAIGSPMPPVELDEGWENAEIGEEKPPVPPPQPLLEYVVFTEPTDENDVCVVATPIEIGPVAAPALKEMKRVVMTSATLSTGGNFGYFGREMGFRPDEIPIQGIWSSPFDFKNKSLLYVSPTAPQAEYGNKDAFFEGQIEEIHELCCASRGGAFILCASHEDLDHIHDGLQAASRREVAPPYRLLRQFKGVPVDDVVNALRTDPGVVAIGVKMLWEGIDIPGWNLRLVIIPRIPFPNSKDVVLTARKEKFVQSLVARGVPEREASFRAFDAFDVNEAATEIKQGTGRLLRSVDDIGVVAVLDPRLNPPPHKASKKYGAFIKGALPYPVSYDKSAVLGILNALAGKIFVE